MMAGDALVNYLFLDFLGVAGRVNLMGFNYDINLKT
jgi:hypothetical protein